MNTIPSHKPSGGRSRWSFPRYAPVHLSLFSLAVLLGSAQQKRRQNDNFTSLTHFCADKESLFLCREQETRDSLAAFLSDSINNIEKELTS